jgi:hypothetical protein
MANYEIFGFFNLFLEKFGCDKTGLFVGTGRGYWLGQGMPCPNHALHSWQFSFNK